MLEFSAFDPRPSRPGPGLRWAPRLLFALAWLLAASLPATAREVTVTGSRQKGFGRILLQFDAATKVTVKSANSVLVVTFAKPAKIKGERLATDLPSYVSAARRDPDETGLRLALASPYRASVLEAGERIFIDLLPPGWSGLPPSLPAEVVAELAERARIAEEKLGGDLRKRPEPKPVGLRLAILPTLTRLVFEPPAGPEPTVKNTGEEVLLGFPGAGGLADGGQRPRLAPGVELFEVRQDDGSTTIRLGAASGFAPQVFREDGTVVVDLARPVAAKPAPAAAPTSAQPSAPAQNPPPARAEPTDASRVAVRPPEPPPARVAEPARAPAAPAAAPPPASPSSTSLAPAPAAPATPALLVPRFEPAGGGTLVLPFGSRPPAAALVRGDRLLVVLQTRDRLDPASLTGDVARVLPPDAVTVLDDLLLLRLALPPDGAPRLLPDGTSWRVSLGGEGSLPPDVLKPQRGTDESGRAQVTVAMPAATGIHWLREPDGSRLAIVTAAGRPVGLPSARSFVEFGLLATVHGLAVEARADDLSVGLGQAGVAVTRDGGLSLTPLARLRDGGAGSGGVITRDGWAGDRAGPYGERVNRYVAEAADAPSSGRAEARFRHARFLLANDLAVEAASVLALARHEDAVFARRRETVLLSGIANVRAGHMAAARAILTGDTLVEDSEAILWRAAADAQERRWEPALAGFRRSFEVVEGYPDEVAGPLRLLILEAALELGDVGRAEAELAAVDRLMPGSVPRDDHDLARARVDEAAGRTDSALKGYGRLAETWSGPAGAGAVLRGTVLGSRTGTLDVAAATARLELLSVAWRGGEIEIATLSELARLYGRAGRWRDVFALTRLASRHFPDHELTRALQDETARRIESLLLGPESDALSPVETVALYFDFKELTPVGRRADEIVRRLADRLVELDLLDKAADLLQHQVEKRLSGIARATVGARLATVRLMGGKPVLALQALRSTRLAEVPEEIRRFRFMLEARAQSDLGRADLALEVLNGETGPDFARLRAGILWAGRRWREAGEVSEELAGRSWEGPMPLGERERSDVIRAMIAAHLGNERIALDRLRQKFGAKMKDSPDAPRFEILLRPDAAATREFRSMVREAGRTDVLRQLLADWRIRDGAVAEAAAQDRPAGKGEGPPPAGRS